MADLGLRIISHGRQAPSRPTSTVLGSADSYLIDSFKNRTAVYRKMKNPGAETESASPNHANSKHKK